MENKPRYSRISDILDLAIFMSSKVKGVTITEIAQRYDVSRRTAERMRNSLTCIFPQIDIIDTSDNQKHWGFLNYSISSIISFTAKEIANLELIQKRSENKELKEELLKTIEKLKTLNCKNKSSIESKIKFSLQTQGYAVHQVPKYKINPDIFITVQNALLNSQMITGIYHDKKRLIEPLGIIYGEKTYLIAREKAKGDKIYNYLLHKFESLKLSPKTFDRLGFNLQEYANESFGVYHDKILDVKLLFNPNLAQKALNYDFHPTQKIEKKKDGSVVVNFKASGSREILRHVFKWGDGCKILEPQELKEEYIETLKNNLKNYE